MRLIALISACVALALSSGVPPALAASSHSTHRTAAHASGVSAAKRPAAKTASSTTGRTVSKRGKTRAANEKAIATKTPVRSHKGKTRRTGAATEVASTAVAKSGQKATSQDFLEAAGVKPTAGAKQPASHSTPRAKHKGRRSVEAKLAAARASDLAGVSLPATPSPASVTRSASVNPRLATVEQEAAPTEVPNSLPGDDSEPV